MADEHTADPITQVPLYEMRLRSEYDIKLMFQDENFDGDWRLSAINPAFKERLVGMVDNKRDTFQRAAWMAQVESELDAKRKLLHPPKKARTFYRVGGDDDGVGAQYIINNVGHDCTDNVVSDTAEFKRFVEMGEARRKSALEQLNMTAACLDDGVAPDHLLEIADKRSANDLLAVDTALAWTYGMLSETCHNKETRAVVSQHVEDVQVLSTVNQPVERGAAVADIYETVKRHCKDTEEVPDDDFHKHIPDLAAKSGLAYCTRSEIGEALLMAAAIRNVEPSHLVDPSHNAAKVQWRTEHLLVKAHDAKIDINVCPLVVHFPDSPHERQYDESGIWKGVTTNQFGCALAEHFESVDGVMLVNAGAQDGQATTRRYIMQYGDENSREEPACVATGVDLFNDARDCAVCIPPSALEGELTVEQYEAVYGRSRHSAAYVKQFQTSAMNGVTGYFKPISHANRRRSHKGTAHDRVRKAQRFIATPDASPALRQRAALDMAQSRLEIAADKRERAQRREQIRGDTGGVSR